MSAEEPAQGAKALVALSSDILKIAKENPAAQEAGQYAAKSLSIIAKTVHTVLLPLSAINFGVAKFADYMKTKFSDDLSEATANIPPEHLITPKASIAGPALQSLTFTFDEPDLKAMYLNLIATAMDGRNSEKAHPAFVEIVKQLAGDEAAVLKIYLTNVPNVPICEIRTQAADSWQVLERNVIHLLNADGTPSVNPQYSVWVDNWVRLGLYTLDLDQELAAEDAYNWIAIRPEYLRHEAKGPTEPRKGVLARTTFGAQFGHAVGAGWVNPASVAELPSDLLTGKGLYPQ
jgi:hypothetical protein